MLISDVRAFDEAELTAVVDKICSSEHKGSYNYCLATIHLLYPYLSKTENSF